MRVLFACFLLASPVVFAKQFGEAAPADAAPLSIAQAVADPSVLDAGPRVFSGRVGKVCQKKGCWMMLTEGDTMVRVMTGYRFFLPTDAQGDAVVVGTLARKELEAGEVAHMAKDAGQAAPAEGATAFEWQIDATGIRID